MAESRPARRFSLRFTIAGLLVALLVLAIGGALLIGFFVRDRALEATAETLLGEVGTNLARTVADRFRPAAEMLRAAVHDADDALLIEGDEAAWARQLAGRVRFQQAVEWMGYLTPDGRGAGAIRMPDGSMTLLHTVAEDAGDGFDTVFLERSAETGEFEIARRLDEDMTAFQEVAWYALGARSDQPTWSKRYVRKLDGELGRACALGWKKDGRLEGVFALGFGTAFVSRYVEGLRPAGTGRLFTLHHETGEVALGPDAASRARLQPVVERARDSLPRGLSALTAGEHVVGSARSEDGTAYVVGFSRQEFGPTVKWINAVVVAEEDLVGYLGSYLRWGLLAILALLVLGALLALLLAHRIARPLKEVAADLGRVGRFELDAAPIPPSRIREVAAVGEEVERMKSSLRSFGRYVPTELVQQLVAGGREARLGGEMRTLTLFFSDVKGFTSVSEGMEVQTLVDALGEYLDVVVRAVSEHEGTVDKFMGDGVLAFFNAPREIPDHVRDACRASLAVQQALAAQRSEWGATGRPEFLTRIGLHTDEVLVGNIGTPERFGYTVLGDGVNFAARLESLNKAYGTWILASEALRQASGDAFEWRRVDRTSVAGRREGGDVHELLGAVGSVDATLLEARDLYEQAFADYLARRFAEAKAGFGRARALRPDDLAAEVLGTRAATYSASPPPEGWNGVFVQTKK